ncbi:acyl-CoA dehydrogenase [Mycobacterium paraffinicum]|uniref:Acyl-CoA dehydrogenase n=2 Tax=Mycobacterium paraffinicum TaxID=53378 RepID=A0A1Q4HNI2_9MYCO|nr:acyl-CoA dehydrogenase [Mycobacterium paraffinicum]
MNVELTNEQLQLQSAAARVAANIAAADRSDGSNVDRFWDQLVDIGVPALRLPALCDKVASGVETAIVIEQFGKRVCPVPVLGQAVLATELLDAAEARQELALVADGSLRLAPVLSPNLSGFGSWDSPGVAFDTAGATHLLSTATSDGWRSLARVPSGGTLIGLDRTRELRTAPGHADSDVTLIGKPISPRRWQRVEAVALIAAAADLVGVMQGALDDAVQHVRECRQSSMLGTSTANEYSLADSLFRVEGARSCLWHAAWAIDHLAAEEAFLAAMTAKAYASEAGRDVVETAMEITAEQAISGKRASHLRVRRMLLDRRLFGDESIQYESIATTRLACDEPA